jgi:hypothetical protein
MTVGYEGQDDLDAGVEFLRVAALALPRALDETGHGMWGQGSLGGDRNRDSQNHAKKVSNLIMKPSGGTHLTLSILIVEDIRGAFRKLFQSRDIGWGNSKLVEAELLTHLVMIER